MLKPSKKIKKRKLARQEENKIRQKISRQKRKHGSEFEEQQKLKDRYKALDKLVKLSQEMGGYDIVEKENNE